MSFLTLSLLVLACNNDDDEIIIEEETIECSSEAVPNCISEKIDTFETRAQCQLSAKVIRYRFQNKCVFLFHEGDCIADNPNIILNDVCDTIGSVGGFSPEPELVNGESFSTAIAIDTLWQSDKNNEMAIARISWTGDMAVDGCGYQVLINEIQYKPKNESAIPEEFKTAGDSTVTLVFNRGEVTRGSYCGFHQITEERKITIVDISHLIFFEHDTIWHWPNH